MNTRLRIVRCESCPALESDGTKVVRRTLPAGDYYIEGREDSVTVERDTFRIMSPPSSILVVMVDPPTDLCNASVKIIANLIYPEPHHVPPKFH